MGINMYLLLFLFGESKDILIVGLLIDELIEKVDGFVGVFLGM